MSRFAGPLGSRLVSSASALEGDVFGSFRLGEATGGALAVGHLPGVTEAAGLSLRVAAAGQYNVCVCSQAGRVLMEIGPYGDDEVATAWRRLSASSGLPFVVTADEPDAAPAREDAAPSTERRKRLAVLGNRRPRFLTRRKTGRLPRLPAVHREREIAGGLDR